ncbi:MAG: Isoleucyl-tRNA synthetase [Microgenomates group bacterium GW2011_GWF2_47_9]|nr:MAG: Isoleucyl-tRNA synthetase [Microgenomates group bacterium GW2011_GWF2_47_9]
MSKHKPEPVSSNPDFVAEEKKLLTHFYDDGIVKKYLAKNNKSDKHFTFFDGPITANNPMGVHHGWGRTYKDLWQKYKNLRGFKQRFQNGFDCQGLWVEVEVEKELGFTNKKQIEEFGVSKFVELCKARVKKFSAIQTEQSKRLGYFMDWDNSYFTMSDENNYMIWHFLKECHRQGWIYKGHDSVPWCPRCQTAISQHEMLTEDYKELVHDSVYLELPIVGRKNEFLLIWTTTPWTIPANIAVAVDPKLTYARVKGSDQNQFWLAEEAVERVFGDTPHTISSRVLGSELVGLHYTAPFDHLPAVKSTKEENPETFHSVIATDPLILPISPAEGTGLVHTAVSAGSEDFKLGLLRGLPMIPVIDDEANYLSVGFGEFGGKNAKKHPEIILDYLKSLEESGHDCLFKIERIKHRYPACWRCKTELVWKVADEWYIAMDKKGEDGRTLRSRMKDVAAKIHWLPEFGLERELDWLSNMHDWLISKPNRYWGLALPIYECSCGHFEVLGSREELHEKAISGWEKFADHSPHKPEIDSVLISCEKCGKPVSRISDVGNVWLDAGIIPFSTLVDPETARTSFTTDKKYFKEWFPGDFITESFPGQFKNWFYSMIAMSTVLADEPSFKTVLGYASMLGEDGRPMHKSWGNAIEFNEGAEKIGVDIMRWTFVRQNPSANLLFGYSVTDQVRRQFHLILWNSYRFLVNSRLSGPTLLEFKEPTHILDRWLLSRFASSMKLVEESMERWDAYKAAQTLEEFVLDLSTWYIRRSRDRAESAIPTLNKVLVELSIILSPFMPYLTDRIYTNLTGKESVHLTDWPKAGAIDHDLERDMATVRDVVEKGHRARKLLGIRVRQPLANLKVEGVDLSSEFSDLIKDELNVKAIEYQKAETINVEFDTELTEELKSEGRARDLMRDIQGARKAAGLTPETSIVVELPDWPSEFTAMIKSKVNASELRVGSRLKIII